MIVHAQTKRTFLSLLTRFSQNHPVVLFVALLGCFLLVPSEGFVYAQTTSKVFPDWFSLNNLLYVFFEFFAWLVQLAARIFLWVVDVKAFSKLMNDGSIYIVWRTVRDFCNIFFILVLLFSAFATIFQLEKYEWKKTIPMLILMALLVNFSFPISRFVIDLANVPMYFFAQNTFGESINSISSSYLGNSGMKDIILPKVPEGTGTDHYEAIEKFSLTHLLAAIVCMFLFGISFLVLALLMLIRMTALAILVMFSPIGFVGLITPALHKFAHDWWDKLFKWAFYGPIAMMLVLVAIVVMRAAKTNIDVQNVTGLTGNSVNDSVIAAVAFFAIPIVLFWIAITQAEKYSNDMSGLGIKFGSNMGRKVGGWLRRGAIGTMMYIPKQSGIVGGVKSAWENRRILGGSNARIARENREAAWAERLGYKGATVQNIRRQSKKYSDDAIATEELKRLAMKGDKAAAYNLAEKGEMDDTVYQKIRPTLEGSEAVINLIDGKIKEKRVDLVMNYKINQEAKKLMDSTPGMSRESAIASVGRKVAQDEMKKLAPSKWKEQNLKEMFTLRDGNGNEVDYRVDVATGDIHDSSGAIIRTAQAEMLKSRINGVKGGFFGQTLKNKDKILDDMSGEKFAAGRDIGLWTDEPYAPVKII